MMMTDLDRTITIISLINASIFYVITILVFLIARKTGLNKALAIQKTFWLGLVLSTLVLFWGHIVPQWAWSALWVGLSLSTWWVLYEVYRANWDGGIVALGALIVREVAKAPKRLYHKVAKRDKLPPVIM